MSEFVPATDTPSVRETRSRDSASPLVVDIATGPASSYQGLRRAIGTLTDAGADFTGLAARYPQEWRVLSSASPEAGDALADLTIFASERRLHRESEHTFRVVNAAAMALCEGTGQLGAPLRITGAGRTDFTTLRGLVRATEYARATGTGQLVIPADDALRVSPPTAHGVHYHPERVRALRLMGLDVREEDLREDTGAIGDRPEASREHELFDLAVGSTAAAADRIAAAIEYSRIAFYAGNWEGMAEVGAACLPLTERLTEGLLAGVLDATAAPDEARGEVQAMEFEPALLRHPADVRAYLLKVLGIQATYRERQDEAVGYFRAMRETDQSLSPELRSQSHLYAALTLTKRKGHIPQAVTELEAGFEAVRQLPGEEGPVRRERGWLHNLRALTLVHQRDLVGALRHEKLAWACLEGMTDASSVHLRVNLLSNISVLQERAGKAASALRTWDRFAGTGFEADPKFVKHYAYRTAGLRLLAGDADGGRSALEESLGCCEPLHDDFHEHEIAMELATHLLDDEPKTATDLYDRALAAAEALGDPYRVALARTGQALAAGVAPDPAIAQLALTSTTNAGRAARLAEALRAGADECRARLPLPRTKLNRPFDLVNL